MTSNTTPSGVCASSSAYPNHDAYKAFGSGDWQSRNENGSAWLSYTFPSAMAVKKYKANSMHSAGDFVAHSFYFQAYENGSWISLDSLSVSNTSQANINRYIANLENKSYTAFRIYLGSPNMSYSNNAHCLSSVNIYGRKDV